MAHDGMTLTLRIWRQPRPDADGRFVDYTIEHCSPDMSFLELLDVLNCRLTSEGGDPVAFDYDCREGICGSCAMMIDGIAHGPERYHLHLTPGEPKQAATRQEIQGGRGRLASSADQLGNLGLG